MFLLYFLNWYFVYHALTSRPPSIIFTILPLEMHIDQICKWLETSITIMVAAVKVQYCGLHWLSVEIHSDEWAEIWLVSWLLLWYFLLLLPSLVVHCVMLVVEETAETLAEEWIVEEVVVSVFLEEWLEGVYDTNILGSLAILWAHSVWWRGGWTVHTLVMCWSWFFLFCLFLTSHLLLNRSTKLITL